MYDDSYGNNTYEQEEADFNELFAEAEAEEGPAMMMEAKAFERVGPSGKLAEFLSSTGVDLGDGRRENIPLEDRFMITLDAVSRGLAEDNTANISEADINIMLEKASSIENLKYKNPTAFILGYLASEGGRSLKKQVVHNVITKVLPKVAGNGGITPPDVIRYARYWKEYL